MKRSKYLGLTVAACMLTRVAAAQPKDTGGASDADSDDTDEVDPASAAPAEPEAPAPPPEPAEPAKPEKGLGPSIGDMTNEKSPFSYEPFGYLRMQYKIVQNDPNVAHVGRDDGFELQNARFGVRGQYAKRVRYVFAIDGAVEERLADNRPQGQLRVGLRDAFVDALTKGRLFVRAGFFQTWSDPQRLVADTLREFVDRPIESRGVRATEGWQTPGLPPGRSIGAAVRSEPDEPMELGFEVAFQNGADEFASNNDNDLLAISAAVMMRLADDGFLVAGARYNPRTVGELPFRQDETDLQGQLGVQINTSAVRIAGAGIVQRTTFGSTAGPVQNAFGAHAQLTFRIPAGMPVWVGYRFGILDPSSLILTDRVMEHTAGGYVGVPQLRMRVQLQLTHVMEQAARELSNSRVQIAAEVTL